MVKPILSRIFQGLFFASFVWIYLALCLPTAVTNPGYLLYWEFSC